MTDPVSFTETSSITTSSTVQGNYEAIILETFKSSFSIAAAAMQHDTVMKLLAVVPNFHTHLLFSPQTQEYLDGVIFEDKKLRDIIYDFLVRLKFFLEIDNSNINDIIEFIANTGIISNEATAEVESGHIELSKSQILFNQAYTSKYEDRIKILSCYEWNIVIFLGNMYYVEICTLFEKIAQQYPTQS